MKIMITGGTGFIGNQVLKQLINCGNEIYVFCRTSSDISLLPKERVKIFFGDITDPRSVEECMKNCNQVYHFAAYAKNWAKDPGLFLLYNNFGIRNILDTALKLEVEKILFVSTSVTFGPSNGYPVNEQSVRSVAPLTDYERSKLEAEKTASKYSEKGLNIVTVNPTRLIGPGLPTEGNSVSKMIELYLKGKFRFILGEGNAIGNYVFIDDVVWGCIKAMEKGKTGEKYILGGENISYNELFSIVTELSGKNYRMIHIPKSIALLYSNVEQMIAGIFNHYPTITPGWVETFSLNWSFSSNKAINEIDYKITPVSQAIEKTIEWIFLNNQKRK